MKKVVLFLVISMFFVVNANAQTTSTETTNNNANTNGNSNSNLNLSGFYVGAKAGVSSIKGDSSGSSFESSAAKGSFSAGYQFSFSKFAARAELEYDIYDVVRVGQSVSVPNSGSNTNQATSGNAQGRLHTIHANAYLDIITNTIFTPYVGIGIGVGIVGVDIVNSVGDSIWDETYAGLSLQAALGTAIHVHKNIAVDVGFKMNYFDKQGKGRELTDVSIKALPIDLYAGLRFTF